MSAYKEGLDGIYVDLDFHPRLYHYVGPVYVKHGGYMSHPAFVVLIYVSPIIGLFNTNIVIAPLIASWLITCY